MDIQILLHMQKIFHNKKSIFSMLLHRVRLKGAQVISLKKKQKSRTNATKCIYI